MRRYFDNAATSFPKPPAVAEAVRDYLLNVGVSAGRGAYREAVESGQMLDACRAALRTLLGCRPADHVVFAFNGTDALNTAIKSIVRAGDHVVTTCLDHNSVLRPLSALERALGVSWTAVAADPATTLLDPAAVISAIRPQTRLVIVNHASNVTGALQDVRPIAAACRERGVLFLLDAAQSAGHLPIRFAADGYDLLACPGHKGLLGPPGTGVLIVREGVERQMRTFREGGTGSASERPVQPEHMPDKFESGCHNSSGLAGLLAAVRWLQERGVEAVRGHEVELSERLIDRLESCEEIEWYGTRMVERRVGVFSLRLDGVEPGDLSAILEQQFGILTRSGLHCAPLAHQLLGTAERGGATRISFGPFLTERDVDGVGDALIEIARGVSVPARAILDS